MTVVLLTCSYRDHEFIRVGYYVNNDYADPELSVCLFLVGFCILSRPTAGFSSHAPPILGSRENPPAVPDVSLLVRNILAAKPRVTRYQVCWWVLFCCFSNLVWLTRRVASGPVGWAADGGAAGGDAVGYGCQR